MQPLRKDYKQDEVGTRGFHGLMSRNSERQGWLPAVGLAAPAHEPREGLWNNHPIATQGGLGLPKWAVVRQLNCSHQAQDA